MAAMAHFFLKLIAARPTFAMDMNAEEKAMMAEHVAYWKAKLDSGQVVVFGPVFDPKGSYGMGVVAVPDEAAARLCRRRSGDQIEARLCLRNPSDARGDARNHNRSIRE